MMVNPLGCSWRSMPVGKWKTAGDDDGDLAWEEPYSSHSRGSVAIACRELRLLG